ncbi:hypothetical protein ON010_g10993 [Phytophthora cinnamomi]|nr:hypothetical protein ON010_g10993 [Phytophthora cinnamomi]
MRFQFVVLWLAVVASHAEAAAIAHPDKSVVADQLLFAADKEFPERALRTDDEERGGVPGLSTLAGLLSKAGPSAENLANKIWLSARTNPKQVFNSLHLADAGVKLEDNPTVLQWLKYVEMYRAKKSGHGWHDSDVYFLLLQATNSEAEVAKLFQSLTENPKLATLGKSLQETQFASWIFKSTDPRSIPSVLGLRNADPIVVNYAIYFSALANKRAATEGQRVSPDELGALLAAH